MEAGVKNSKVAKALLSAIEEADDEKYKSQRAEEIKALAEAEDTGFLFGKNRLPEQSLVNRAMAILEVNRICLK